MLYCIRGYGGHQPCNCQACAINRSRQQAGGILGPFYQDRMNIEVWIRQRIAQMAEAQKRANQLVPSTQSAKRVKRNPCKKMVQARIKYCPGGV